VASAQATAALIGTGAEHPRGMGPTSAGVRGAVTG